jgi:hypothetical protein
LGLRSSFSGGIPLLFATRTSRRCYGNALAGLTYR